LHLAKECLLTFRAIAKGYQITFRANGMRNPGIACNADNVINIPLRELNFKFKKKKQVLKFCLPSAVFVLMKVNPTIPL
jgi:hypothetical protein